MQYFIYTYPDLKALLVPEAVSELVIANMPHLPRRLPKTFKNSYTPIAAAGTDAQVGGGGGGDTQSEL